MGTPNVAASGRGGQVQPLQENDEAALVRFSKDRSCTDVVPLICMVIFFATLFGFIAASVVYGDIDIFFKGYDDCGNVCGKNNIKPKDSPYSCFGKDMTDKKYLLAIVIKEDNRTILTKECVEDCEAEGGFILYSNRCFLKSTSADHSNRVSTGFFHSFAEDFHQVWVEIILMSVLALVFSIIMVLLLRYATAFVVWFILIAMVGLLVGVTIYLWVLWYQCKTKVDNSTVKNETLRKDRNGLLVSAIFGTIFIALVLCIMMVFFKRIKFIIQLFKEAAKAIMAMPFLLIQPTCVALLAIFVCGCYSSMWTLSYSNLGPDKSKYSKPDTLTYIPTNVAWFASAMNYFGMIWMIQFVIGCQHFIVGGCVATWFFARNKTDLGSPITSNYSLLLKFHLGTVAFGSLIITIVEIVKQLVEALRDRLENKDNAVVIILFCILEGLLNCLEQLLKYFSRNAYIMTAVYGYPFCKGGKKAFKLLMNNIFSVLAINSVGDFVLSFIKLFIVILTTFIGYEILRTKQLNFIFMPLLIIALISIFIAHCFISVYEMAIDTIFLCFCEDCEQNDGISKPYYMSRNLMEFVENSSKFVETPWQDEQRQAWENGPRRVLQQGS